MMFSEFWLIFVISFIKLSSTTCEDNDPVLDTSNWIPIVRHNVESEAGESTSSDRILNSYSSGDKLLVDAKFIVKKSYSTPFKLKEISHIKRSPNQKPKIKLEQPYRLEDIFSPPPKQQLRPFQQNTPYQPTFNLQPQYQLNLPNLGHIVSQDANQQFPILSNPTNYNPNNIQNIPKYSSAQLEIQYQQPNIIHKTTDSNGTSFQQSALGFIKQGLFENTRIKNANQNIGFSTQLPPVIKDTVQLLYVPVEQLQQKEGINSGILDEAFKSLQQQKLVSRPPAVDTNFEQPESTRSFSQQSFSQVKVKQQEKYPMEHNQAAAEENEENRKQQYYFLRNAPVKNQDEEPRYYELLSKNHGEWILQNDPRVMDVSNKQKYQVQAEKQYIVELTSPQPIPSYLKQQESDFRQTRIQNTRNKTFIKEPLKKQSFTFQNQASQPFSEESSKLRESHIIQHQHEKPMKNVYYQSDFKDFDQQLNLPSIHKDILQQSMELKNSQEQIQQGKASDFQEKNTVQPPKNRKIHQPPLAIYMEGNSPADLEALLRILKYAKSIAVQDQFRPNSPQVFIGPSNLNLPEGFAKFPLPYLSNIDNNRIQRKAQQFPFFVAPINYKEPEGYSKIPLPSPHIGSIVISQFKQNQVPNYEDNRPISITDYKYVNPAYQSGKEINSNFDENLNDYSLDKGNPRDNTKQRLKEQTLLQQITGFSGSDYPQQNYSVHNIPNEFSGEQERFFPEPQSKHGQHLDEIYRKLELGSIEGIKQEIFSSSPNKQITRGERVESTEQSNIKEISVPENSKISTKARVLNSENMIPEIPTPNIVQTSKKVKISSPLNQGMFNRFSSNNNFNFNYVSSTPDYAIPTQNIFDKSPANVKKLITNPTKNSPDESNSQAIDAQFEQSVHSLRNNKNIVIPHQEEKKVHIYNQYGQFELPSQLTDINPNLPGLINELQHQNQYITLKYRTELPPSTTQYSIRTTDVITLPSTTTKRPKGRGRSRFNMGTTTSTQYRRSCGERRRPCKTSISSTNETTSDKSFGVNTYTKIENEIMKPRTRLQNLLTGRIADGSEESNSQHVTEEVNISPKQQNNSMILQSAVINENHELKDYGPETRTTGAAEQYQNSTIQQIPIKKADRSKQMEKEVTQKPSVIERTIRKRVRVRGRPTNKYSSTTIAPIFSSTLGNEQTEFYGFIRQPDFSKSSQMSGNNKKNEENIHIYAPTQNKISLLNEQNKYPLESSSPLSDTQATYFLAELRSKHTTPSKDSTTQLPNTFPKRREGSRLRVPSRTYENRGKTTDSTPIKKSTRIRTRGRTYFTSSRNIRQETGETENYPAPFLKSVKAATSTSSPEFKITVSTHDDEENQIPNSSINITEINRQAIELSRNPDTILEEKKNYSHNDDYEEISEQMEIFPFHDIIERGNSKQGIMKIDQFDTAESQNFISLFNSLDSSNKVNDLKSKKIEESLTLSAKDAKLTEEIKVSSTDIPEFTSEKLKNSFTTTEISKSQGTSLDDISSTILNPVKKTKEDATLSFSIITQPTLLDDISSSILIPVKETIGDATLSFSITTQPTTAITTEDIREAQTLSSTQSFNEEITSTINTDELRTNTAVQTESPIDLLNLQTSTSTGVSRETEICYKGRCVKSNNRNFRKRFLHKKVNKPNL